jgi:hypothetical protein
MTRPQFTQALFITSAALAVPLEAMAAQTAASSPPTPAASTAASQTNPIRITDIQTTKAWHTEDKFYQPRTVNVTFINLNPVPAIEIVFDLRDGGGRLINRYKDVGKYMQGQSVTHGFFDVHVPRAFQMDAVRVAFADGSVWTTPPDMPPPSRRQASDSGGE